MRKHKAWEWRFGRLRLCGNIWGISMSVGMCVRGVGDYMHLLASEQQAGLSCAKEETQMLGKRSQAGSRRG